MKDSLRIENSQENRGCQKLLCHKFVPGFVDKPWELGVSTSNAPLLQKGRSVNHVVDPPFQSCFAMFGEGG